MRRFEHDGLIYLQYPLGEVWSNWRMSDALNNFKNPPVFVPVLRDYLNQTQSPAVFYMDKITGMATFRFAKKADADSFIKTFSPKGGG